MGDSQFDNTGHEKGSNSISETFGGISRRFRRNKKDKEHLGSEQDSSDVPPLVSGSTALPTRKLSLSVKRHPPPQQPTSLIAQISGETPQGQTPQNQSNSSEEPRSPPPSDLPPTPLPKHGDYGPPVNPKGRAEVPINGPNQNTPPSQDSSIDQTAQSKSVVTGQPKGKSQPNGESGNNLEQMSLADVQKQLMNAIKTRNILEKEREEAIESREALRREKQKAVDIAANNYSWWDHERKEKERLTNELTIANTELVEKNDSILSATAAKAALEKLLAEKTTEAENATKIKDLVVKDAQELTVEKGKLMKDLQESRKIFKETNNELRELKFEVKNKTPDTWFIDQWRALHAKIENVSRLYFLGQLKKPAGMMATRPKGPLLHKPGVYPSRKLNFLAYNYDQYLSSEEYRPLIVQAFIWWVLTNKVFDHVSRDSEGLFWAGTMRDALGALKNELRPLQHRNRDTNDPEEMKRVEADIRNSHRWRATTSVMLLSRHPANKRIQDDDILHLIDVITSSINPYIVCDKESYRLNREADLRTTLDTIITTAVDLDAEIHQQRAWIFCEQMYCDELEGTPLWGFAYNEDEMEKVPGPKHGKLGRRHTTEPSVDMIVHPALYRQGDHYGKDYSATEVLCKAKVVLGR
ncbi:hypothetical protein P154DRAFT_562877 [Amniculicola lignicola CBS 123094]|uniref:Uncharacterized protein n=1 Tax=Amniculicola lignicola CBS 123094 TaxID=1392246 RepID=A0A6A5WHZ4_9PLEO|nr:hypothetical protein P154DRAFT_562877 [Amniculicola lignicola CBS 123094]